MTHSLRDFAIGDAFVGFHEDTIPSIVMQVCNDLEVEGDVSHEDPGDLWDKKVSEQLYNNYLMKIPWLVSNVRVMNRTQTQPVVF